jgi:fused signal recognition particle receptor
MNLELFSYIADEGYTCFALLGLLLVHCGSVALVLTAATRAKKQRLNDNARTEVLLERVDALLGTVELFLGELGGADAPSAPEIADSISDEQIAKKLPAKPREVSKESTPTETRAPESLTTRLEKTRRGFFSKLKEVFSRQGVIAADSLEEIEALLIGSDIGVKTTQAIIEKLEARIESNEFTDEAGLIDLVREEIAKIFGDVAASKGDGAIDLDQQKSAPLVVMMVGVNGAGKTTTSAKLAAQWKAEGKKVLLVAADTFRAAAVEQLVHWGEQLDVPVVTGAENAKPATVVFEGVKRATEEQFDIVLLDTAGRLHTRSNLMQELEGVRNSIQKHIPSAPHEVLLVVDGASGQNAVQQAREFHAAVDLTGIVVTKLDGTPRGGTVIAIAKEIGIPVRYIGVGEGSADLRVFEREAFLGAFFDPTGLTLTEDTVSANAEKRARRRRAGNE